MMLELTEGFYGYEKVENFLVHIPISKKVHLQQLKGMQNSKLRTFVNLSIFQ